jgi:tetratricopeptide (TPR) repeat protein
MESTHSTANSRLTAGMLAPLLSLAITSEEDHLVRAGGLALLAEACAEAGDDEGCDAALDQATGLLERALSARGIDRAEVLAGALRLQDTARSLDRPGPLRAALSISIALFDPDEQQRQLGVAWHNMGLAWAGEGNDEQALRSLRRAAVYDAAEGVELKSRLATWKALASAAAGCGAWADRDRALATGLELLASATPEGVDDQAQIAALAHKLGRCAESLERPDIARDAYTVAARLLTATGDTRAVAVTWCDIGDTWLAESRARRALESYRTSRRALPDTIPLDQRLAILDRLARSENRAGTRAGCDAALGEGLDLLRAAAPEHPDEAASFAKTWGDLARSLRKPGMAVQAYRLAQVPLHALPGRLLRGARDEDGASDA